MGGRGSSGGAGGAGGERVGIKLPQILGSEKQINWAKDILTDPYTTFEMNEKLRRSQSVGRPKTDEIRMWADAYSAAKKRYADEIANLSKMFPNGMKARDIIDRRDGLSSMAKAIYKDELDKLRRKYGFKV